MKTSFLLAGAVAAFFAASSISASAATINLRVSGNGGDGLLTTNVPGGGGVGGSGDAITLSYNDVSNVLTYDIRWGSGNGFTDLSSPITVAHIHGPTANPAPTSFNQNGNVAFNLITDPTVIAFNSSTTNGGGTGTWTLADETEELQLLGGQFYFNIHTNNNMGGEIRGYIIPEPSRAMLLLIGAILIPFRRRR